MVETITPVVHGGRARWSLAVALHVIGATAAAAVFGAALGAVGGAFGAPFGEAGAVMVAVTAAAYGGAELENRRLPIPQLKRQVPSWWRTFFPAPVAALLYGLGLGVGFLTFLAHGTLVVVALLAAAEGRPLLGALILAPFGLARGLSIARARRVRSVDDGGRLVSALASAPVGPRRVANGLALLAVAAAALAADGIGADWSGLAVAFVGICFGWSATAKLLGWRRWQTTLGAHHLPAWLERGSLPAVPVAEALVPVFALLGYPRTAGMWGALLVSAFSLELLRVWRRGSAIPCGCFGGRRAVDPRLAIARNAGLGALALVATTSANAPWPSWPEAPDPPEILPMVLAWVGGLTGVWLVWRARTWLGRAARG